jgi:hypothetical protein
MLVRPVVRSNGVISREQAPGDIMSTGRSIAPLTTVGAGIWTGAMIAQGIIKRTGPIGAYIDTTDSAINILTALRGNAPAAESMQGVSFEVQFINTVAFAQTLAAGAGVVLGTQGGSNNTGASSSYPYLFTIKNDMALPLSLLANLTNASPLVTFVLPPGMNAFKMGPAPDAVNLMNGASVTGTNIPAGTTLLNITMGQGGVIGCRLSANATATIQQVITFGPTIEVNGLGL